MRAWAARIEAAPRRDPLTFVVAGDSGAWPDPTADAIYTALARQAAALDPPPLFLANLGDFAGRARSSGMSTTCAWSRPRPPNLCVVGNHDLDDPGGLDAFAAAHGPVDFTFAHGHVRFAVLHSQPSVVGEGDVPLVREGLEGPRRARGAPRAAIAL